MHAISPHCEHDCQLTFDDDPADPATVVVRHVGRLLGRAVDARPTTSLNVARSLSLGHFLAVLEAICAAAHGIAPREPLVDGPAD